MNRTPRPGAPPRAVPDTHAPRRRRALTWAIAALTATAVLVTGALIAIGAGGDGTGAPATRARPRGIR